MDQKLGTVTTPATDVPTAGRAALSVIAASAGLLYVAVGLAGFLVTTVGHDGSGGHAAHLLWFQVNPLHNLAHLALGVLLVLAARRGPVAARQAMLVVGSVFLLLGLIGPLVVGTAMNLVALNDADHLLHLGTSALLLVAAWVLGRRLPPAT